MKRIALVTVALGLGWLSAAAAMEPDATSLLDQRYAEVRSSLTAETGTWRLRLSDAPRSADTGKSKNTTVRRLETYSKPTNNTGSERKAIYNPLHIPLW